MIKEKKIDVVNQQLIQSAQLGDTEAINAILSNNNKLILNHFLSKTQDRQLAEDLTQETMVRFSNNIDKFNYKCKLTTFIIKIANNIFYDHLRKNELKTLEITDTHYNYIEEKELDVIERITNIINEFKNKQMSLVCILFLIENNSIKEISDKTGLSISNIKVMINRGKKEIKKLYLHYD